MITRCSKCPLGNESCNASEKIENTTSRLKRISFVPGPRCPYISNEKLKKAIEAMSAIKKKAIAKQKGGLLSRK